MASNQCLEDKEVIKLLGELYASDSSIKNYQNALSRDTGCQINSSMDTSDTLSSYALFLDFFEYDSIPANSFAIYFYAYLTPVIILIGITGNITSLFAFTSKRLRGLSASHYLAALSASDTTVLMTYVLLGWLHKGLPYWPGSYQVSLLAVDGICHIFLFVSYAFRVISVYLVVVFTIERYIAVCKPLKRRIICTRNFARKLIFMVFAFGAVISLYKPILSGVYDPSESSSQHITGASSEQGYGLSNVSYKIHPTTKPVSEKLCIRNPKYDDISFIFELMYGLLITAIPFLIMAVFNTLIIRRLITRYKDKAQIAAHRESKMRWEFTVMLLSVSTCFILLNIPYFVVWINQLLTSRIAKDFLKIQRLSSHLLITRTIFSLNYCVNFFVYCLTGSYYRGVITDCVCCGRNKGKHSNGYQSVQINSMSNHGMSSHGTVI